MLCTGYINLYRSGYFHRCGKPNVMERHGGDVYATAEAALADIDPPALYIATVAVQWDDPDAPCANAPDSKPVPLSETRREYNACVSGAEDCNTAALRVAAKIARLNNRTMEVG